MHLEQFWQVTVAPANLFCLPFGLEPAGRGRPALLYQRLNKATIQPPLAGDTLVLGRKGPGDQ